MDLPNNNQPAFKIDRAMVEAVLSGRMKAGMRLQELQLCQIFGVSRTVVREALIRLEARGIVQASAGRGWFVIEQSIDEVRETFQARRAIEIGLLHSVSSVSADEIRTLKLHIVREKEAIRLGDVAARTYLLGDFHVCMAEVLGSRLLADILRDLTVRTSLISMMYQSTHKADESCEEHVDIVNALEAGDMHGAARLMIDHIEHVELGLRAPVKIDPLTELRDALRPLPWADNDPLNKSKLLPIEKGAKR